MWLGLGLTTLEISLSFQKDEDTANKALKDKELQMMLHRDLYQWDFDLFKFADMAMGWPLTTGKYINKAG